MKNSLLLALVAVCTVTGMAANAGELTVMTFNVRYGSANDGGNAWPHRKETLVAAIREYAPDLLGLQECLDFQAAYIVAQLPEYGWFGLGRRTDGTGEMTPILYRKARFFPVNTGHFWLSETPDLPGSKSWKSSLPRIATWGRLYDPAAEQFIHFINTHFDHRSASARLESAKLIAQRAASFGGVVVVVRLEGGPTMGAVIVAGDQTLKRKWTTSASCMT